VVEGYAGSAIQVAALRQNKYRADHIAIMFVHGINAHGMREKRRWTKEGIDLNRNYVIDQEWPSDENNHIYQKANQFLNPPHPDSIFSFYLQALYYIIRNGYTASKQAVAGGQSIFPGGLFYRGKRLAPPLVALDSFLRDLFPLNQVMYAIHIDIHTGLGPRGEDTLIVQTSKQPNDTLEKQICASDPNSLERLDFVYTVPTAKPQQDTIAYTMLGGVAETALHVLFPKSKNAIQTARFVQEFGTEPPLAVLRALRNEAALIRHCATHHLPLPSPEHPIRKRIAHVFAPTNDSLWTTKVIDRGLAFFHQAVTFLLQHTGGK